HLRCDDRRDRPRHEHHGAHQPASLEARVDDQRDDQPERELECDGDQRELDRLPHRVPEERVVPEVAVILEADPLRRREPEKLRLREALVDGFPERVHRDERDDRQRRREEQPGEARLTTLELRPASAGGLADRSGDRGHRRSRERMTGAILSRFGSACLHYLISWLSLFAAVGSTLDALAPLRIWLMLW